ncbi:hypothetical protein SAMN00768000_0149 [Sulfobacillus thermosulfidooxidans DSM 9293]|uniref:Uncharacterized protein n=1 Tax=Sulfobacillus thermosulfidooxidans (strain DSM 9293 / VKM B-1269 / AT-1) TaxID=929705 RepID=A0A1W1W6J7_SULTA|nr:hypothetical protein SAMN00768000_0149 [Sulfobacillus thermosulfidooxidans DSM 9293]
MTETPAAQAPRLSAGDKPPGCDRISLSSTPFAEGAAIQVSGLRPRSWGDGVPHGRAVASPPARPRSSRRARKNPRALALGRTSMPPRRRVPNNFCTLWINKKKRPKRRLKDLRGLL